MSDDIKDYKNLINKKMTGNLNINIDKAYNKLQQDRMTAIVPGCKGTGSSPDQNSNIRCHAAAQKEVCKPLYFKRIGQPQAIDFYESEDSRNNSMSSDPRLSSRYGIVPIPRPMAKKMLANNDIRAYFNKHRDYSALETKIFRVNIDTRFRPNIEEDAEDCLFKLYNKMRNIISLRIVSAEVPNTAYVFTTANGNLTFKINGTSIGNIGESNYTATQLETEINSILPVGYSLIIDIETGRATISAGSAFTLDFTTDSLNMGSRDFDFGLGYNLGFRQKEYSGASSYTSEGIVDVSGERYIFLQLGDFSNFDSVYNHSLLNQTIFAKLVITGSSYSVVLDNEANASNKKISLEQPVDIDQFKLKLFNVYGKTLDLNKMNYSLTVEMEQIIDSNLKDIVSSRL